MSTSWTNVRAVLSRETDVRTREIDARSRESDVGSRERDGQFAESSVSRGLVYALLFGGVVLVTWLELARISGGTPPWNSLWAEDGSVFVTDAYHHSLVSNLFRTHGGYLQVVARLVGQPAAHLPVSWAAAWMAWSSAAVVAVCALIVWNRAGKVAHHWPARVAVTLLVPFMPQLAFEVSAAANDLHWYLMYTLFWVFIVPPKSVRGGVGATILAVLAGLSDPLTALMLMAAAVGFFVWGRDWRTLVAPVGLAGALIGQWVVHVSGAIIPVSRRAIPEIYGLRVGTSSLTGDHLLSLLYPALGVTLVIAACTVLVALVAFLIRRATSITAVVLAVTSFVLSLVYLGGSLALRGDLGMLARHPFSLAGSRYTIVPLWLLFTGIILLADVARGRRLRWGRRYVTAVPLVLVIACGWLMAETMSDWSQPTVRTTAPVWSAGVQNAVRSCHLPVPERYRVHPGTAGVSVGADDVVIPVAPESPNVAPGFGVVVSCQRLGVDNPPGGGGAGTHQ